MSHAGTPEKQPLTVEVWSDVICPFCYIGKRRLEGAIAKFAHGDDVKVVWHSFQLDPSSPRDLGDLDELLAKKYGMTRAQAAQKHAQLTALAAQDGLDYHFERARPGNTLDAHRLVHLADQHGLGGALEERLMHAYFSEGLPVGDKQALAPLAVAVGLPAEAVAQTLASDAFADEVRSDQRRAQELGIRGVPAFLVDGKFGVSGAQSVEHILGALEQAWRDRN